MNIQDLISTIINYVKNMDKKNLVIFTLIALLFYRTRNVEGNENVSGNHENIREQIKQVYQADVQAIKNLGDLAGKMFNPESGKLVLPYDVQIDGELITSGATKISGPLKLLDSLTFYGDSGGSTADQYIKARINSNGNANFNGQLSVGVDDSIVISNTDKRGNITFKSKNGETTLLRGYNNGTGIAVNGSDSKFVFQGQCEVDKELTVKGNISGEKNLTINKNATIRDNLSVGPNEDIKIFQSNGRSKISMKMDDKVGTIQAYKVDKNHYRLYFDDKFNELYVKGNISGEKSLVIKKMIAPIGNWRPAPSV